MAELYILDGYNIARHRLFSQSHPAAADLKASLIEYINSSGIKAKVTIVFDGWAGPGLAVYTGQPKRICVIFSGAQTADDKIKKMISSDKLRLRSVGAVVSDDREILNAARLEGISCIKAEDFLLSLSHKRRAGRRKNDVLTKESLNNTQVRRINQELKDRWVNKP